MRQNPTDVRRQLDHPSVRDVLQDVAALRRSLVALFAPGVLVLVGVVLASRFTDRPVAYFTRDPAAEVHEAVYLGILSNVGVVAWAVTAAVCLFAAHVATDSLDRERVRFLLASAALSAILMVDDVLLLHEEVFPDELHVHQGVVLIGYVVLVGLYLIRFAPRLLAADYPILVVALGFFAVSFAVDVLVEDDFALAFVDDDFMGRHLLEDGCKFIGILGWVAFFVRASAATVSDAMADDPRR